MTRKTGYTLGRISRGALLSLFAYMTICFLIDPTSKVLKVNKS